MSAILPRLVRRLLALLLCAGGLAAADPVPALTSGQTLLVPTLGGTVRVQGTDLDQILASPGAQGITIANSAGASSSTASATVGAGNTALIFTAPARSAGTYAIVLPYASGTLQTTVTYRATPTFSNLPVTVFNDGSTACVLQGENLDLVEAVKVGGSTVAATRIARTATSYSFFAPVHEAGTVNMVSEWVIGENTGTVTSANSIIYYGSAPVVVSDHLRVSTQGGSVTIAGTSLNLVTGVTVGGVAASITSQSASALTLMAPAHPGAGTVDGILSYGSATYTAANLISYVVTPSIASPVNTSVLVTGGALTLNGSDLNLVSGVSMGGATVAVTSQGPAQMMLSVGAHAAGIVNLNLDWIASGLSGQTVVPVSFRAVPLIAGNQKLTAKTDGSTTVTFTGSDLDLLTSLTVTGVATACAVSAGSTTQAASIIAPARAAGTVDATASYAVGGISGQSAAGNLLVYAVGPVVTSGLALSASTVGSTSLVITGTGLDTVTGVMVGGTTVTMNTGLSSTRLPITVPAMAAGAKAVVLTWMASGALVPATHAAGSFVTYVEPVPPVTPPFTTDGGGGGGCGLGGVAVVLAAGSLLLVRRRRD